LSEQIKKIIDIKYLLSNILHVKTRFENIVLGELKMGLDLLDPMFRVEKRFGIKIDDHEKRKFTKYGNSKNPSKNPELCNQLWNVLALRDL